MKSETFNNIQAELALKQHENYEKNQMKQYKSYLVKNNVDENMLKEY